MKMDKNKQNKAKLAGMLLSLTAVSVALILAISVGLNRTFGWFANNLDVYGKGMAISADTSIYELSVSPAIRSGAIIYYDSMLSNFGFDVNNTTGLITTSGNPAIKWVMVNETDENILMPGTYGTLTFSVIPYKAGEISLHFDISLDAYYAKFQYSRGKLDPEHYDSNTLVSLETLKANALSAVPPKEEKATVYQSAMDYIYGHILFFKDRDSNLHYSNRIDPDIGFYETYTVTDGDIGVPREITIYWTWPDTFLQLEFDNDLPGQALFSSSQPVDNSGDTPREELNKYISENKGKFFSSTVIDGLASSDLATMLATLNSNDDNILTLSNGYNNADQIIGDNIRLVLVSLTADIAGGTW